MEPEINVIMRAMKRLTFHADPESDHSKADDLLCQALRSMTREPLTLVEVEALIEQYQHVEKWYE